MSARTRAIDISDIDFTKAVAVTTLACAAGIDPSRLQSRARREKYGLVEAATPTMGGRFAWVTGDSAAAFIKAVMALKLALRP